LRTGTFPGVEPRLLRLDNEAREGRVDYTQSGGYAGNRLSGTELINAVESAGLRGRGGAAFPTSAKLRSVADRPGPRFAVANGEEGEPTSVKDRWLLRHRPHLVIDGLHLAMAAVDAQRGYVYVSDAPSAESVRLALDEVGSTELAIELILVPAAYVAGEETAVIRAIGGDVAKPLSKPPRPFESGVEGRPTLVANVETLANLPFIASHGPEEYRRVGTNTSPGTFLLALSGGCTQPGLYEVPLGTTLGEAIEAHAGVCEEPIGFLMGGYFAGLLNPRALDVRLAYDELRDEGSGLGCGAVIVLGSHDCPVAAASDLLSYFARENAKQCGACIRGTAGMRDALVKLSRGDATQPIVDRLRGWSMSLRERGACALLDGAATVVSSLLREFPDEIESHLRAPCGRCAELISTNPSTPSRFVFPLEDGSAATKAVG
jgi:NADH:ubiquinone oxidoreductase subunit F (NADH-binding)